MTAAAAPAPLTEAQWGLWYAQALDPANPIFNTGQYLDLRGPLDVATLRGAIDAVGAEAEALALRFGEGPSQWIDAALRPRLEIIEVADEAEALAAIRREMAIPVDPTQGPLAAQHLYRIGPERHFWAQRVHHLANDGYGMVLLTSRVAELYGMAVTGGTGTGRPFRSLEKVWAEDAAYRQSADWQADANWWRAAMAGMGDVVGMAPGRAVSAHHFHRHAQPMPDATRAGLLTLAKDAGLNWPDALTALVAAYCGRFTGTGEIVIGVPHMGRFGSASARVPAMVMNVLPVRVAPDEDVPLPAWLARMAAQLAEARKHGRYRSEQLRRDLGLIGGARRLYGPLVNVQPYDRPPRFHGLDVTLHVTGTGPVEDINFTFRGDGASALTLEVDANPDLYDMVTVAAHGARLAGFLANAIHAATLTDIPTATPEETEWELEAHNATAHPLSDASLAELIERAMVATPDVEALRFEGESLSYAELDRRSQALAGVLRGRGIAAEVIVAVALPRSIELLVALVAVLRAGGAYLPLDLDHPAARIATILESAKPVVVLALDDPHSLYGDRLLTLTDWPLQPPEILPLPLPDHAAYVIYTSGSTGEPKGVVVTHRAIVNRLLWMGAHYAIGADARILQKTPATFDVSVWELFLPLIRGATLVIAPPGAHRDPVALAGLIRAERIDTLHFVPSMLAAFLDAPDSDGLAIGRVFVSGEELPADLRDRFHARMRGALHNLYGPTEAAVDVSYWPASADDTSRPVPIGHPVWNTRLLLLDDRMRPVPPGMVGHLHLGGVQLARGYLGRDDLTARRFVADPFHPGERLYRTGDLARRRADGAVVFLGRADHQVKIRGLRIELGEIEAAIAASGMTRATAVLALDGRLVAYIVPGEDYAADALRSLLAARLPDYMLPAAIVALDALPVTANGKLDRKALPTPRFKSNGGAAPATATEQRLAAFYAELLGVKSVSRTDDFFALGGDSLGAVQLMLRIRQGWGHDPGLGALFEHPVLADLAARIDAGAGDDAGLGPLVTLSRDDRGLAPLFVVHPAGGLSWGYRTLANALSPRRTVIGLQSPSLDPDAPPPASIEALAADYARRMIAAWPQGPYHIAGWSVGGIIAHAIAVELTAQGRGTGLVALLDAYPADCWRAELEPTQAQALRALLAIAGYDPEAHPELETRAQVATFLRAGASPLGNLPPRTLDGVIRTVLDTNRLVREHRHHVLPAPMLHIRAALDHRDRPQLQPDLWASLCTELESIAVPFLHSQLTGAAASALIAPALSDHMAVTERLSA